MSDILVIIVPIHSGDIQLLDRGIISVVIASQSCNERDYTIFDFSRFTQVEYIKIGNGCFESVQTFKIDGLNRLKTIKIGNHSFTKRYGNDESRSFHILNCESLKSIQIGKYSFSYFGGDFELKNLPQLQSIQIGTIRTIRTIGNASFNFGLCSFVIRGIELILNI